jgi:hypothetical protein
MIKNVIENVKVIRDVGSKRNKRKQEKVVLKGNVKIGGLKDEEIRNRNK